MHSIPRSPEPGFLSDLRAKYSDWDQLEPTERRQVRRALAEDFLKVCAYCEQSCVPPTPTEGDNEESVDHLRPRRDFPGEWLSWLNLVYACRRCNQSKGSKWPVIDDDDNRRLSVISRYQEVSDHVCPNQSDTLPRCESLFEFDLDTGEIGPANGVDDFYWSMAKRTIDDIDLNSVFPSYQDLPELRRARLTYLETTIEQAQDPSLIATIVNGLCQRNQEFSSFLSVYARSKGFDIQIYSE